MMGQVKRWVPLSPAARSHLFAWTHHFFQVVLHGLGSGGPNPLLEGISGSSSALRVVNVFCSCKPLHGAGVSLLVPEVTNFRPSHSPAAALTLILGVDTAYFSAAVAVWGSSSCCVLEKSPFISPSILSDAAQLAPFLL